MSILKSLVKILCSGEKSNNNTEYGEKTYKRIMNSSKSEIDYILKQYGLYSDYKDCSKLYIAERLRNKAKEHHREYI